MSGLSIAPDCRKLPGFTEEKYEDYIKKTKGSGSEKKNQITSKAYIDFLSIPCKEKKCQEPYKNCKQSMEMFILAQQLSSDEITKDQVNTIIDKGLSEATSTPEEKTKLKKLKETFEKFKNLVAKIEEIVGTDFREEKMEELFGGMRSIKDEFIKDAIATVESLPGGKVIVKAIYALASKLISALIKQVEVKAKTKIDAAQTEADKKKIKMKYDAVLKGLEHISDIFGIIKKSDIEFTVSNVASKVEENYAAIAEIQKHLELQDKKAVVATGGKRKTTKKRKYTKKRKTTKRKTRRKTYKKSKKRTKRKSR